MVVIRLAFTMIPHRFLVGACAICLAEGVAPLRKAQPVSHRLLTVGVSSLHQEMPEPHPPTGEAGVQFEAPPIVASAVSSSAGFLEDDSGWYMTNVMRPSSGWSNNVPQRFYDSDWS